MTNEQLEKIRTAHVLIADLHLSEDGFYECIDEAADILRELIHEYHGTDPAESHNIVDMANFKEHRNLMGKGV